MVDDQGMYFLVIGRMTGDDEDTPIVIQGPSYMQAVASYREQMWEMEEVSPQEMVEAEREDRGCIVNVVFESDTPIRISTGGA